MKQTLFISLFQVNYADSVLINARPTKKGDRCAFGGFK